MMFSDYETGGEISAEGKLVLDAPAAFVGAMRDMKRGRVSIRVAIDRGGRSQAANRYYWGIVLRSISEHTGFEVDELHEYFKQAYNPRQVRIGPDETVVGGSTRSMNTQQFHDYVERIRRFAATELGISLPDPYPQEAAS
jgi:hypothetical protein